jgi:hypothetical protein
MPFEDLSWDLLETCRLAGFFEGRGIPPQVFTIALIGLLVMASFLFLELTHTDSVIPNVGSLIVNVPNEAAEMLTVELYSATGGRIAGTMGTGSSFAFEGMSNEGLVIRVTDSSGNTWMGNPPSSGGIIQVNPSFRSASQGKSTSSAPAASSGASITQSSLLAISQALEQVRQTGQQPADISALDVNEDGKLTEEDAVCVSSLLSGVYTSLDECPDCVSTSSLEICHDGVDNNCDGQIDSAIYQGTDLCACNNMTPCGMLYDADGIEGFEIEGGVKRCNSIQGGAYSWKAHGQWACGETGSGKSLVCNGQSFTCSNMSGLWRWVDSGGDNYPPICDYDRVCDEGETFRACPSDCLPELTIELSGPITTIRTSDGMPLSPIVMQDKLTAYTEIAPIIVDNKIFVSTGWTYSADYDSVNANFIENPDAFKQKFLQTNRLVYGGDGYVNNNVNSPIMRSAKNNNILSQQEFEGVPFWRATYMGAYDIEKMGNTIYLFSHGEHVNIKHNGICYQSNMVPEVSCNSCNHPDNSSQYAYGCPWTYRTFVNLALSENSYGTNFIDEGPIVWPANGFTDWDANLYDGFGASHPGTIIKDNYLYVYYKDFSDGDSSEGRSYGIKVARAPLNNVHAGSFESWYKLANGTEGWEPSLPEEFWSGDFYVKGKDVWNEDYQGTEKGWITVNGCIMWNYGSGWLDRLDKGGFQCFNNINDYSMLGGRSSDIFGSPYNTMDNYWEWPKFVEGTNRYHSPTLFKVAKIKGTNYYLGVLDAGGYFNSEDNNDVEYNYFLALGISKDLIHWSNFTLIEDTITSPGWENLRLGHVNFLDSNFKTNNEIDQNGFYLVGSHDKGFGPQDYLVQQLNYKFLKISLEGSIAPAPTCTSFTYSAWSPAVCPQSEIQTRTITSSSPSGCQGGNPVLTQTCGYNPEICDGIDNNGDGRTDEGCDDDFDHFADASMACEGEFYSMTYFGDYASHCPADDWCSIDGETYFNNGLGWFGKFYSCDYFSGDVNDNDANIHPEICNLIDDDGDGSVDEGCDDDMDGIADANMLCPFGQSFRTYKYSEDYAKTCPASQWCQLGGETWWSWGDGWIGINGEIWYNYGTGWISRDIPCNGNSGDTDDGPPP